MACVILSIGVPGSGKTTVMKKIAERGGFEYVGPDALRLEKYQDEMNHADDEAIWVELRSRVADALSKGKTVVVDSTFHTAERRKHFIEFARENGVASIEGLYFDIPLETVLALNQGRAEGGGKLTSNEYIQRVHPELAESPPKPEEGFDALFKISEKWIIAEIISTSQSKLPEILRQILKD